MSATTDHARRRGFTLIELLVVILIILLVSAVALPTVFSALNHRQVSEAGRIFQGALVGARDKAIHDNQPSGIRLLPDPTFKPGSTRPTGQFDADPVAGLQPHHPDRDRRRSTSRAMVSVYPAGTYYRRHPGRDIPGGGYYASCPRLILEDRRS